MDHPVHLASPEVKVHQDQVATMVNKEVLVLPVHLDHRVIMACKDHLGLLDHQAHKDNKVKKVQWDRKVMADHQETQDLKGQMVYRDQVDSLVRLDKVEVRGHKVH